LKLRLGNEDGSKIAKINYVLLDPVAGASITVSLAPRPLELTPVSLSFTSVATPSVRAGTEFDDTETAADSTFGSSDIVAKVRKDREDQIKWIIEMRGANAF